MDAIGNLTIVILGLLAVSALGIASVAVIIRFVCPYLKKNKDERRYMHIEQQDLLTKVLLIDICGLLVIFVFQFSSETPKTYMDQFAILGLCLALLALVLNRQQVTRSTQDIDDIRGQLNRIEGFLNPSRQENQPQPDNIPAAETPDLPGDNDNMTLSTRITSNNRTVTSTVTVTSRRE